MRIKIGRRRVAYAGFVSAELAEIVCRYWNITAEHFIEPWAEAIVHDAPDSRARTVVLFRDEDDFRAWLKAPETFDVAAHTISLHPGVSATSRRRSA